MKKAFSLSVVVAVVLAVVMLGCVLSTGVCWAQVGDADNAQWCLGVKGGLAMGACSGLDRPYDPEMWTFAPPGVDNGIRYGMAAGGFVAYRLSNRFYIQPEVLYTQQGCKRDVTVEFFSRTQAENVEIVANLESTVELDFVQIPLLVKFVFNSHPTFKTYFMAGPSIGIKVGSEMPYEYDISWSRVVPNGPVIAAWDTTYSHSYDIDDLVKSTSIGATVGIGMAVKAGPGFLSVEARYLHGFTDLMDQTGRIEVARDSYVVFDEIKSHAGTIMVGYGFPIGGR